MNMQDQAIVDQALAILDREIVQPDAYLKSPADSRNYLTLRIGGRASEVFVVLWLNTRHGVIGYEELYLGSIDACHVPAREVVARALRHNAAAAVFAHNHPSGDLEPSPADRRLTDDLLCAMRHIDVRVLDHLICGGGKWTSFAERGWI